MNFALLKRFNVENVLVVWSWPEVNKKHGEWLFGAREENIWIEKD
jgi:hypothetical protein